MSYNNNTKTARATHFTDSAAACEGVSIATRAEFQRVFTQGLPANRDKKITARHYTLG